MDLLLRGVGSCELQVLLPAGERVFDVAIQGNTVLEGFDIVKEAGGPDTALVKKFKGVEVQKGEDKRGGLLEVSFSAKGDRVPLLNGIEYLAE